MRFRELSHDPFFASKIALRYGRWKLNYDRLLRRYRLYDVAADPHERKDLSMSHRRELRDLQQRLRCWLNEQARVIQELSRSESDASQEGQAAGRNPPGGLIPVHQAR